MQRNRILPASPILRCLCLFAVTALFCFIRLFILIARRKWESSDGLLLKAPREFHPRTDLVRPPLFRDPVSPGYSWTGVSLSPALVIALPVAVRHSQKVYRFTQAYRTSLIVLIRFGHLRAFLTVAYAFHTQRRECA